MDVNELSPGCRLIIRDYAETHFDVFQPPDGGVYVDVGTYTGEIAARAAGLAKDLMLILVEPNPLMPAEIAKNLRGYDKLVMFQAAAGPVDNTQTYLYSHTLAGWGGSLNLNHPPRTMHGQPVTTSHQTVMMTLDTLLEKAEIDTVDFVKMDVEGFESQALQGLTKYHEGTKFYIEYHWNLFEVLFQLDQMKITPKVIEFWTEYQGSTGAIHAEAL